MAGSSTRLAWACVDCDRECIPIRSESRCLCGHRHKEHSPTDGWQYVNPGLSACWVCNSRCKGGKSCACRGFFYVVAEGAWILRCRCKHKHIEHNPATHACAKPGCGCVAFDSPWVCNCDHSWADHRQVEVEKKAGDGSAGGSLMAAVADLNRWDLLRRGADGGSAGAGGSGSGKG